MRNCALPYLEEDHPEVRRAAAETCCRLFIRDPICYQASNHSIEIISDVIDKLLTVAIADPGTGSTNCIAVRVLNNFQTPVYGTPYFPPSTNGLTSISPKQRMSGRCSSLSTMKSSRIESLRSRWSVVWRCTTPHTSCRRCARP